MRSRELRDAKLGASERTPTVIGESGELNIIAVDICKSSCSANREGIVHYVGIIDKDSHTELQRSARARCRRR